MTQHFKPEKLLIAGVTNTTEYDAPDLVFVYVTDTPDDIRPDFFKNTGLTFGDVVIAGPLGSDGKFDPERACFYSAVGTVDSCVLPFDRRFFRWVAEFDAYKPAAEHAQAWEQAKDIYEKVKTITATPPAKSPEFKK